jgi:hypothetical protein
VLSEGDLVDDCVLIVRALELLEAPYVAALDILDIHPLGQQVVATRGSDVPEGMLRGLTLDQYASCLASLETVGLVRRTVSSDAMFGQSRFNYRVTDLGQAVLTVIREVAPDEIGTPVSLSKAIAPSAT